MSVPHLSTKMNPTSIRFKQQQQTSEEDSKSQEKAHTEKEQVLFSLQHFLEFVRNYQSFKVFNTLNKHFDQNGDQERISQTHPQSRQYQHQRHQKIIGYGAELRKILSDQENKPYRNTCPVDELPRHDQKFYRRSINSHHRNSYQQKQLSNPMNLTPQSISLPPQLEQSLEFQSLTKKKNSFHQNEEHKLPKYSSQSQVFVQPLKQYKSWYEYAGIYFILIVYSLIIWLLSIYRVYGFYAQIQAQKGVAANSIIFWTFIASALFSTILDILLNRSAFKTTAIPESSKKEPINVNNERTMKHNQIDPNQIQVSKSAIEVSNFTSTLRKYWQNIACLVYFSLALWHLSFHSLWFYLVDIGICLALLDRCMEIRLCLKIEIISASIIARSEAKHPRMFEKTPNLNPNLASVSLNSPSPPQPWVQRIENQQRHRHNYIYDHSQILNPNQITSIHISNPKLSLSSSSPYYYRSKKVFNIIQLLLVLLPIAHSFSIIIYLSTFLNEQNNWLSTLKSNKQTASYEMNALEVYIYSFYFTITTMLTVGYGDISPVNIYEIIIVIGVQIIGFFTYGCLVNEIGFMISRIRKEHEQKMIQLIERFLTIKSNNGHGLQGKVNSSTENSQQSTFRRESPIRHSSDIATNKSSQLYKKCENVSLGIIVVFFCFLITFLTILIFVQKPTLITTTEISVIGGQSLEHNSRKNQQTSAQEHNLFNAMMEFQKQNWNNEQTQQRQKRFESGKDQLNKSLNQKSPPFSRSSERQNGQKHGKNQNGNILLDSFTLPALFEANTLEVTKSTKFVASKQQRYKLEATAHGAGITEQSRFQ